MKFLFCLFLFSLNALANKTATLNLKATVPEKISVTPKGSTIQVLTNNPNSTLKFNKENPSQASSIITVIAP